MFVTVVAVVPDVWHANTASNSTQQHKTDDFFTRLPQDGRGTALLLGNPNRRGKDIALSGDVEFRLVGIATRERHYRSLAGTATGSFLSASPAAAVCSRRILRTSSILAGIFWAECPERTTSSDSTSSRCALE